MPKYSDPEMKGKLIVHFSIIFPDVLLPESFDVIKKVNFRY